MKGKYLDLYKGVKSEILLTTKFDENSDLGVIYLGEDNMARSYKVKQKNDSLYHSKVMQ